MFISMMNLIYSKAKKEPREYMTYNRYQDGKTGTYTMFDDKIREFVVK